MEYELIDTYPGSPMLGARIKKKGNFWKCTMTDFAFFDDPSKHPRFWKPVKETLFRILELENIQTGKIHKVRDNKISLPPQGPEVVAWEPLRLVKSRPNLWKISSVKRLTDGEVFRLGDRTEKGVILGFDSPGTLEYSFMRYKIDNSGRGWRRLSEAKKIQKIFTSQDGIDIFKGDAYWKVCTNTYTVSGRLKAGVLLPKTSDFRMFSTKEAADNWVYLHKLTLCRKEVLNLIEYCTLERDEYTALIDMPRVKLWLEPLT